MRVFVVQVDYKPDVNLIVFKVVNERSTTCIATQGPAHSVGHLAFFMILGLDFPDFFHAQAIFLNIRTRLQIVFRDHLL